MNDNMDFEEYIRQGEPDKKEKGRHPVVGMPLFCVLFVGAFIFRNSVPGTV